MSRIIDSVPCQEPSSSFSGAIEICAGKREPSARRRCVRTVVVRPP